MTGSERVADYSTLSRCALRVAIGSHVGLLLMMVLTTVVIPSGGRAPNWTVGLLLSVPLLGLLPGVVRGGFTTHIWTSFVAMLYFAIAVTNLFLPRGALSDWIELVLSVALFTSTMLFVRWRSRARRGTAVVHESEPR